MSNPKQVYFARPMSQYHSESDQSDIREIELLGFRVADITNLTTQTAVEYGGMSVFEPIVKSSEALFFRPFPNDKIGAGVAKEINWARESGIPVFELAGSMDKRTMDVKQTRAMLKKLGQR